MHVLKDLKNNVRNISNYTEKVTFYTYTEYPYYLETAGGKFSPIRRDNVDTMQTTIAQNGERCWPSFLPSCSKEVLRDRASVALYRNE